MGKLIAINISEQRGTPKESVGEARLVKGWGIEGDAHGGDWHRQVSLLSLERIEEFNRSGAGVQYGDFGENLVISGFDFRNLPVGTRFRIGEAVLEMTQIGKECHSHCMIFQRMGECIMPREGVFAVVINGGTIRPGDEVEMTESDI
ncbi:MAG: MOSC domain-containing protein [Anaerovoracaceae bacterium]